MLLSCFQIFSCSKNNGGRRSSEAADKRKDPNDSVSHKAWAGHAKTQHEVIGERAAMMRMDRRCPPRRRQKLAAPTFLRSKKEQSRSCWGFIVSFPGQILKTQKTILKRSVKIMSRRAIYAKRHDNLQFMGGII